MQPESLSFMVRGTPIPQGSMKAFVRGNRAHLTSDNKNLKTWREQIALTAAIAMGHRPLYDGPVKVIARFTMARPAGHYGKRGLLPSAPKYPAKKPDVDKMTRALLDALTGVVLKDDSQVVLLDVGKFFDDQMPGVAVAVAPLGETPDDEPDRAAQGDQ